MMSCVNQKCVRRQQRISATQWNSNLIGTTVHFRVKQVANEMRFFLHLLNIQRFEK